MQTAALLELLALHQLPLKQQVMHKRGGIALLQMAQDLVMPVLRIRLPQQ